VLVSILKIIYSVHKSKILLACTWDSFVAKGAGMEYQISNLMSRSSAAELVCLNVLQILILVGSLGFHLFTRVRFFVLLVVGCCHHSFV
jgi:hypothetical protein